MPPADHPEPQRQISPRKCACGPSSRLSVRRGRSPADFSHAGASTGGARRAGQPPCEQRARARAAPVPTVCWRRKVLPRLKTTAGAVAHAKRPYDRPAPKGARARQTTSGVNNHGAPRGRRAEQVSRTCARHIYSSSACACVDVSGQLNRLCLMEGVRSRGRSPRDRFLTSRARCPRAAATSGRSVRGR